MKTSRTSARLLLAGLGLAAMAVAVPAGAEDPAGHERNPAHYEAPPPLPTPAMPQPPRIAPKSNQNNVLENENEERRTGLRPLRQKPLEPGAKPEMVGKEKLWSTRDPPNQRGVFAFLGNRLGDPIENLFPDPVEKDEYGMPLCRGTIGIPGFLDCADDSMRDLVNGIWVLHYRGVEISYLNYRYLEHKLIGFQMGFPTENFAKLADVLERQYGAPNTKEDTIWKIRPGYELPVKTWAWHTPQGTMSLKSRAEATEAGMLSLIEPKAEEQYNALRYKLLVSRGFNVRKPGQNPEDNDADAAKKNKAAQEKAFEMDDPERRVDPELAPAKTGGKPAASSPTRRLQME